MEALEKIVTPIEGSGSVDSVSSFYGKLEETICSCDLTNGTCGVCSNVSCKKQYSSIKKGEKLPAVWEEAPDKYGFIIKNTKKFKLILLKKLNVYLNTASRRENLRVEIYC